MPDVLPREYPRPFESMVGRPNDHISYAEAATPEDLHEDIDYLE